MTTQKASSQLQKRNNNTIETGSNSIGDFPREIVKHAKDQINPMGEDFFSQLLGIKGFEKSTPAAESNDLRPGEEIIFSKAKKQEKIAATPKPEQRAAHLNYFAEISQSSERMSRRESQELQYQINQIMDELQRLISSSDKVIQMQYGHMAVSSAPKSVGKYHINFFSYMLLVIREARIKVENSGSWIAAMKGKGKKGNLIQDSWKAGNTSVTMSNERGVATQTG